MYHEVRVREPLRNCASERGDRGGMCIFESLCVYASVCGTGTGIGANRYLYPCRYSIRQREPQIGLRHIGWGCANRAVSSADVNCHMSHVSAGRRGHVDTSRRCIRHRTGTRPRWARVTVSSSQSDRGGARMTIDVRV